MRFTWEDPGVGLKELADGKHIREIDADRVAFTASHVVFRDSEHAIILAVLAERVHNLRQDDKSDHCGQQARHDQHDYFDDQVMRTCGGTSPDGRVQEPR